VLVKSPPLAELPLESRGPLIACFRALFAGLCLIPFVDWKRARFRARMVPMIVAFAAMNFLFIAAMTRTTAAAAIFLQYTGIGWAFLFGAAFLKEPVTRGNAMALIFGFAGIGWIVCCKSESVSFDGTVLALGSGLAYGGVIASLRSLRDENPAWLVVINHLASGIVLLPWVASQRILPTGSQWALLGVLGAFQMGLPYVLFARGVAGVPAQEAGLITLLEAVLNPVWVWIFWQEEVDLSTWIGGGLILSGLLLRYALVRGKMPA